MLQDKQIITRMSAYYTDRGKYKTGPVFDRNKVWEGDTIMAYDYDLGRHMEAVVTKVDPDFIYFYFKANKINGIYDSAKASENVPGINLPHVYLK